MAIPMTSSKSSLFGDVAMLAFIVLQCLDGATYR